MPGRRIVLLEFDQVTVYAIGKFDLPCPADDSEPGERQLRRRDVDKGAPELVLDYFGIFTGKDTECCRSRSLRVFAIHFLLTTVEILGSLQPSGDRWLRKRLLRGVVRFA